jgi:hypothetical protein
VIESTVGPAAGVGVGVAVGAAVGAGVGVGDVQPLTARAVDNTANIESIAIAFKGLIVTYLNYYIVVNAIIVSFYSWYLKVIFTIYITIGASVNLSK